MTKYPTIKVLDLALYIKDRIDILDSNELKGSPAAKKEIELMTKWFPKIRECMDFIEELEIRERQKAWASNPEVD